MDASLFKLPKSSYAFVPQRIISGLRCVLLAVYRLVQILHITSRRIDNQVAVHLHWKFRAMQGRWYLENEIDRQTVGGHKQIDPSGFKLFRQTNPSYLRSGQNKSHLTEYFCCLIREKQIMKLRSCLQLGEKFALGSHFSLYMFTECLPQSLHPTSKHPIIFSINQAKTHISTRKHVRLDRLVLKWPVFVCRQSCGSVHHKFAEHWILTFTVGWHPFHPSYSGPFSKKININH